MSRAVPGQSAVARAIPRVHCDLPPAVSLLAAYSPSAPWWCPPGRSGAVGRQNVSGCAV